MPYSLPALMFSIAAGNASDIALTWPLSNCTYMSTLVLNGTWFN